MSCNFSKSIKKGKDIWSQLLELKAVTADTGTIHEAQVQQLRLWGWLACPHATAFTLHVGLPHLVANGTEAAEFYLIEYRVTADARPPKNLKKRLEGLDRSIKDLLGNHFETKVVLNGTTIFNRKGGRREHSSMRQRIERIQNDGGTSTTGSQRKGAAPRSGVRRAR